MHLRPRIIIGIGAGLLLIPLSLMAASVCSEDARRAFDQRVDQAADVRDQEIDRLKQEHNRAKEAAKNVSDTNARKAMRRAADQAFNDGRKSARDQYKQEYSAAKTAYSAQKNSCRTAEKQRTRTTGSGTGANCQPYICSDARRYPTCSREGYPINYFVDPCRTF